MKTRRNDVTSYHERDLGSRLFDVVNITLLIGAALSCVLPIWYIFSVSLSDKSSAAAGAVLLWPLGFNLNSYTQIIKDATFFNSFWISVQRVVLGTGSALIAVTLMAYPLSKSVKVFPARNILMWILVICMLFNGGLIPWYQTIRSLGLINNIWALAIGSGLPIFSVILMVNFFRNIPKEVEEAAMVDGAGPWFILLKIFVPLSLPVIATITLLTAVDHWNDFFNGLVLMNDSRKYPLQTYIQQLVVTVNTSSVTSEEQLKRLNKLSNQTLNAAKLFIAMLPIMVIYPFLQRYFITGITLGSVKE
jgi:putative aldouronate transport system permease protein